MAVRRKTAEQPGDVYVPAEHRRFRPPPGYTAERLAEAWRQYHEARDAWFTARGLRTQAERSIAIGRSIRADRGEA